MAVVDANVRSAVKFAVGQIDAADKDMPLSPETKQELLDIVIDSFAEEGLDVRSLVEELTKV